MTWNKIQGWVEVRNPAFQRGNLLGFRKAPTHSTC